MKKIFLPLLLVTFVLVGCGANDKATEGLPNGEIMDETGSAEYVNNFGKLTINDTLDIIKEKLKSEPNEVENLSYTWNYNGKGKIKVVMKSSGGIQNAELTYNDEDVKNDKIKVSADISSLEDKDDVSYSQIKSKLNDVDGVLTYITASGAKSYVWYGDGYKFTATVNSSGIATTFAGVPKE